MVYRYSGGVGDKDRNVWVDIDVKAENRAAAEAKYRKIEKAVREVLE